MLYKIPEELRPQFQRFTILTTLVISGEFAERRKASISFVMSLRLSVRPSVRSSVCPHGKTRLSLDEFS